MSLSIMWDPVTTSHTHLSHPSADPSVSRDGVAGLNTIIGTAVLTEEDRDADADGAIALAPRSRRDHEEHVEYVEYVEYEKTLPMAATYGQVQDTALPTRRVVSTRAAEGGLS